MNDPSTPLPLFVYGTLLPTERHYQRFLYDRTLSEVPARIRGQLWLNERDDYPYLCQGDGMVHGCLMVIRPEIFRATIQAIDRLEEFDPSQPAASLYLRQQLPVLAAGKPTRAWTYLWNRPTRPGYRLVSGSFSLRPV